MAQDDQGRKKSYLRLKEDIPGIVNRSETCALPLATHMINPQVTRNYDQFSMPS